MDDWQGELLSSFDVLPKLGVPGSLEITDDSRTRAIVRSDEGQVLAAAAAFGEGRIFVIAHEDYLQKFKRARSPVSAVRFLQELVRDWASKGRCKGAGGIRQLKKVKLGEDAAPRCKIVFYKGGALSADAEAWAERFVENGGGLVHGVCPATWMKEDDGGASLSQMPLGNLLAKVGIAYSQTTIDGNNDGFRTEQQSEPEASHVPPAWLEYEDLVQTWRREILGKMDSVRKLGSPGCCLAYGARAVAVLAGSSPQNVVVAASEYGSGRVVTVTQDAYVKRKRLQDTQLLMRRLRQWLTRETISDDNEEQIAEVELRSETKADELNGKKLAVWTGADLTEELIDKVSEFVHDGGALLHAITPWGWKQQKPGRKLQDIPLTELLNKAGLAYIGGRSQTDDDDDDDGFAVDLSDAGCLQAALDNVGYAISTSRSRKRLAACGESLASALIKLDDTIIRHLADDIRELYDCFKHKAKMPKERNALQKPKDRGLVAVCDVLCRMGHADMRCIPCVDEFPGSCPQKLQAVCVERTVEAQGEEFHSTGLYAVPGQDVQVDILDGLDETDSQEFWTVRIGCHTDELFKLSDWKRWPRLTVRRKLTSSTTTVFSPYGGLIYLQNPEFRIRRHLTVRVSGAIESLQFDANEPDAVDAWRRRKEAEEFAPWSELHGELITLVLPTETARRVDDPALVMATWDRVVRTHYELRTAPVSRRQWLVPDVQPRAGYMHAGYPIVTHMDVARDTDKLLTDAEGVTRGKWGVFHELGHNMQRKAWTFRGTGEVTCNIFTLHAMQVVCGHEPWIHTWLAKHMNKIGAALHSNDTHAKWVESPGIALGLYAQLQHEFGWPAYKTVFAHYENLPDDQKPEGPVKKVQCWIRVFSKTVGYNLCPLFEFWGFELSGEFKEEIVEYGAPYLPDDEMTRLAPERVQTIVERYPGVKRETKQE